MATPLERERSQRIRVTPSQAATVVLGQNPGLQTGPGTNTYVFGMDRLILIDTGEGSPAYDPLLQQAVSALKGRLSLVLISHGHQDHIGGLPAVQRMYPEAVARKFPGEDSVSAIAPIAGGELIRHDGTTLQAIHTPGHATDHLCFYWLEERVLFSGDLILGEGTAVIPRVGGSLTDYLASLERLRSLDIRRIYPGHGPVIEDPPAKITEYIEHRHMRERQVLDALHAGARTVPDMVSRIYTDVRRELHPLAEESVWNHLVKLGEENRVRRIQAAGGERYELLR